jgi:outer membrane biosynthesis protein TonB
MRLSLLLLISISFLLANRTARAQSALDYFNSGAQFYISNSIPTAKSIVEQGLKTYPDDDKLQKLKKLLDQKQQQNQQQQQQNQSQSQQQKQSQDQKNQQKQDQQQQKSEGKQQQDEQQKTEQQKEQDQKQQDQKKQSEQKADDKNDEDKKDGQPVEAGQMTPEEAKRLLDTQKNNEQFLQLKPKDKADTLKKILPDW